MELRKEDVFKINLILELLLKKRNLLTVGDDDDLDKSMSSAEFCEYSYFIVKHRWAIDIDLHGLIRNVNTERALKENLAEKFRRKQKRDSLRFWITTAIGIATLLAAISTLCVSLIK